MTFVFLTAQIPNCYPQQLNRDVVKLWKSKDLGYEFYSKAVAVDNGVANKRTATITGDKNYASISK